MLMCVVMKLVPRSPTKQLGEEPVRAPWEVQTTVRLRQQVRDNNVVEEATELMLCDAEWTEVLYENVHGHFECTIEKRVVNDGLGLEVFVHVLGTSAPSVMRGVAMPSGGPAVHREVAPIETKIISPKAKEQLAE